MHDQPQIDEAGAATALEPPTNATHLEGNVGLAVWLIFGCVLLVLGGS